jgi:hypothetical protein
MKPIDQMTLPECIEALGIDFDDTSVRVDLSRINLIADRIHDITRWIPVEERYPTEKDADRHGYVLWWSEDEVALPVAHYWDFTGVPKYLFTHWRRITPPEAP